MNTFEDRKKSFEKKFAHDEELQFKISARKNKYLGEWSSKILGHKDDKEKEYIQSVIKADFAEAGDDDVFRKLKEDLKDHNISDEEIRKKMDELNEKAKSEFKQSNSNNIYVNTREGQINCSIVQIENKKEMSTKDLLNGYKFDENSYVYQ